MSYVQNCESKNIDEKTNSTSGGRRCGKRDGDQMAEASISCLECASEVIEEL